MTMVAIGIDPHKGSHTAVAVDRDENELDAMQVRSSSKHKATDTAPRRGNQNRS
jgi:hypothetical protein